MNVYILNKVTHFKEDEQQMFAPMFQKLSAADVSKCFCINGFKNLVYEKGCFKMNLLLFVPGLKFLRLL